MTNQHTSQSFPYLGWFVTAFITVLALKLSLASILDLYSDEIFYWWASTRLSLAYSDLPFMTALLAGIGGGFGPTSSFAVRICFLILGTSLPALVYWVARPITDQRMAMESAALTLCLPLAGFMGLLAVPDVPLIFFGLLSIGFFQRAVTNDALVSWVATGCFVALGLSTHYRFFLYPLAAVLFLISFREQRIQWRNWKFWLTVAIASLGLIPIVWFNLSNQLSSASFYLVERHPWEFQPSGLLHIFKQTGLVTPPLYLLFIVSLVVLYRQATDSSDRNSALLFAFSSTNLFVYLVLAPWTDANSTSIHWPLSGYFPLLVVLPLAMRITFNWAIERWDETVAKRIITAIPVIGFAGTMTAFIGVGSQAFHIQLQPLLGTGVLSNKMAGWEDFSEHTEQILTENFNNADPLVITDNYYTAAQLEFAGLTTNTLTLDRDKAVRDGRITQLNIWNKGVDGLVNYEGHPALYINEDSTLEIDAKTELMSDMCQIAEELSQLESLLLFRGDKAFSYYTVSSIRSGFSNHDRTAFPCPYPAQAWIDFPDAGDTISGEVEISGWAYSEDIGIRGVALILNGERLGTPHYGITRQDVVDVRNIKTDPNAPRLGFSIQLDTRMLENGKNELVLELTNNAGVRELYGMRQVIIAN